MRPCCNAAGPITPKLIRRRLRIQGPHPLECSTGDASLTINTEQYTSWLRFASFTAITYEPMDSLSNGNTAWFWILPPPMHRETCRHHTDHTNAKQQNDNKFPKVFKDIIFSIETYRVVIAFYDCKSLAVRTSYTFQSLGQRMMESQRQLVQRAAIHIACEDKETLELE